MDIPTLLHLPGWTISGFKESPHDYQIEAAYQPSPSVCPHCGVVHPLLYRFGSKQQLIMDTPIHGKRVGLLVQRQKYRCRECTHTFYERIPDLDDKRLMTRRLVGYIEREALRRTFVSIAQDVGVDEKTIRSVFADYRQMQESKDVLVAPPWIGIDEVKVAGAMRCVFTDMQQHCLLDLVADRKKQTVIKFLQHLPGRSSIQLVTMDMWGAYRSAIRQVLPQAHIIIDKFHVVRLANTALESVRKSVRSSLTDKQRRTLMRDRYLLLRPNEDLTESQRLILESWLGTFPRLKTAYEAKESFRGFWKSADRVQALEQYRQWKRHLPTELESAFHPLLTAMTNWQTEIFNYFEFSLTNAYTEALNGCLKVLVRQCRGASFEVIRAKMRLAEGPRPKYGEAFGA